MDKRLNGRNKTLLFSNNSNRKEKSIRWKMIVLLMFVLCIQLICFPAVYVNGYYMRRQQNEQQSQANQEEQKWSTRKNSRDHDSSGETTPFTYFSSTQRPLIQPHSNENDVALQVCAVCSRFGLLKPDVGRNYRQTSSPSLLFANNIDSHGSSSSRQSVPFCSWLETSSSSTRSVGKQGLEAGMKEESSLMIHDPSSESTTSSISSLISDLQGFHDFSSLMKTCMTISSWRILLLSPSSLSSTISSSLSTTPTDDSKMIIQSSLDSSDADHYIMAKTSGNIISKKEGQMEGSREKNHEVASSCLEFPSDHIFLLHNHPQATDTSEGITQMIHSQQDVYDKTQKRTGIDPLYGVSLG